MSVIGRDDADPLDAIDWYRRCLEDIQDGRSVTGLREAKLGYDRALDQLRGAVAENEKLRAELHFAGERIRERDRDIEALRIENARLSTRRGQ